MKSSGWMFRQAASILVFLAAGGAAAASADPPARVEVRIENQRVVKPEQAVVRLRHGQTAEIVWTSDTRGELHVHGYDIRVVLEADTPSVTLFDSHATGRFPVTSHGFGADTGHTHGHRPLMYIEVHPD